MSRRWLLGLVVADALCWVIYVFPLLSGGLGKVYVTVNGFRLSEALFTGLLVLFPVAIGVLCSRWQAAIALPVIAATPAIVVFLLTTQLTVQGIAFYMLFPAALGGFGWLLRYVRAEFIESAE